MPIDDGQVVNAVSPAEYFIALLEEAEPWVSIAISIFSIFGGGTPGQTEILQKLDQLSTQIKDLGTQIEKTIRQAFLKERAGEVIGYTNALKEALGFPETTRDQIVEILLVDSAVTQGKIEQYLNADTPDDFYHAYATLNAALVGIRLQLLALSGGDFKMQLTGFINLRAAAIDVAQRIGRQRVSEVQEKLILIDELGPVFGTEFTIKQDGKHAFWATFSPEGGPGLNEVRQKAKERRTEISNGCAAAASQRLVTCFAGAQTALDQKSHPSYVLLGA